MGESGRFLHLRREASEDINRKRTAEADAWEAPSLHESVGELVMQTVEVQSFIVIRLKEEER